MAPFHHFPIDAPPWKVSLPYGFKGVPQRMAAFFISRERIFTYEPPLPWFLFIISQLMRRRGRRRYRTGSKAYIREVGGNFLRFGPSRGIGSRKIIIMLHGASSATAGQAEEEHCKDDKRHPYINPVSLNREGNHGKENPHDRGCNQHKKAELNHSPA